VVVNFLDADDFFITMLLRWFGLSIIEQKIRLCLSAALVALSVSVEQKKPTSATAHQRFDMMLAY
jgi:hypothetical protein